MSLQNPAAPAPETPTRSALNGVGELEDVVISTLRAQIAERARRRDELQAQLDEIMPELRRYEKALALLTGEAPATRGPYRKSTPQKSTSKTTGVGEERLKVVEDAILKLTETSEEFRQVDVRSIVDVTSGVTALAFEALRQRGVIRLARQSGNNKYYRLTRETIQRLAAERGAEPADEG